MSLGCSPDHACFCGEEHTNNHRVVVVAVVVLFIVLARGPSAVPCPRTSVSLHTRNPLTVLLPSCISCMWFSYIIYEARQDSDILQTNHPSLGRTGSRALKGLRKSFLACLLCRPPAGTSSRMPSVDAKQAPALLRALPGDPRHGAQLSGLLSPLPARV